MGDCSDGEFWGAIKEAKKIEKAERFDVAMKTLGELGIPFKRLDEYHLRLYGFDYWPSTGLFIDMKTKKRGYGITNLLKKIAK